MSKLCIKNNRISAIDCTGSEIVFLNANNLSENKSKIPMHVLRSDGNVDFTSEKTILGTVMSVLDRLNNEFNIGDIELVDMLFIFDMFIANSLIKTSSPIKACEFGFDKDVLCMHTSELLGRFNPDSIFCIISDSLDLSDTAEYIKVLTDRKNKPRISVQFSDHEATCLDTHTFDIIVINGSSASLNTDNAIKEAKRLIKDGGTIIFVSYYNDALKNKFKNSFSDHTEFNITGDIQIFKAAYNEKIDAEKDEFLLSIDSLITDLKKNIDAGSLDDTIINRYSGELQYLIKTAVEKKDTKNKIFLIYVHDTLIDHKVHDEPDIKNIYRTKLKKLLEREDI